MFAGVDRAFLPQLYTTYVIYGCQEPQTKLHNSIAALTGVILEGESRLGEGGFIDIVDVNERLLVKPAPTNIVVNLWNQLLLDIFGIATYSPRLC